MSQSQPTNNETNANATTMMGDGPMRCNRTGFETTSIEEWNQHCLDSQQTGDCNHSDTGVVLCSKCDAEIPFQQIPYQKQGVKGKNIQLRCAKCKEDDDNLNAMILAQPQNQVNKETTGDNEAGAQLSIPKTGGKSQ